MLFITATAGPTRVSATGLDPRCGAATPIHTGDNSGMQTFEPPTSGRGSDWTLVLDGANVDTPELGQASFQS